MSDNTKYSVDNIRVLDFEEGIRTRPGMYLGATGSEGIINLIKGLFLDGTHYLETEDIFFHFTTLAENDFELIIKSEASVPQAIVNPTMRAEDHSMKYHFYILKALSNTLDIKVDGLNTCQINWSLNDTIFPDTKIDFIALNEVMTQLAFLHRKSEILITDQSMKYHNQSYFTFPEGVKYIYERCRSNALGKPQFEIQFDGLIRNNAYQIFLGYRTDWHPSPQIISYANEVHTVCGGSLVDGIIEGFITGCRHHVKDKAPGKYKIKKKKFDNGLILVCAVKGKDFGYGGSFKEWLREDQIKKDVKKFMKLKTIEYLSEKVE